jgi:hypothetical protein
MRVTGRGNTSITKLHTITTSTRLERLDSSSEQANQRELQVEERLNDSVLFVLEIGSVVGDSVQVSSSLPQFQSKNNDKKDSPTYSMVHQASLIKTDKVRLFLHPIFYSVYTCSISSLEALKEEKKKKKK